MRREKKKVGLASKAWGSARRGNTSKKVIPSLGKPERIQGIAGEDGQIEGEDKVGKRLDERTRVDTEFGLEVCDI